MPNASVSGMNAAQKMINVTANNIANSKTAGYKSGTPVFSTLMSVNKQRVGSPTSSNGTILPSGEQIGLGVRTQAVIRNLAQGTSVQTDNDYHLLIQGNGFFQIQLPSGETAYTRSGIFTLSSTGEIVTQDGFPVLPGFTIPANALSVSISPTGEVSAKVDGQIEPQVIGQLEIASFANPGGLEATDNSMYLETPASGAPITGNPGADGYGKILQGWYEGSNADTVMEMTNLIEAQRLFEMNSKSSKTEQAIYESLYHAF